MTHKLQLCGPWHLLLFILLLVVIFLCWMLHYKESGWEFHLALENHDWSHFDFDKSGNSFKNLVNEITQWTVSYFALLSLHKNVTWSYDSQKWPNEILHSNNQFIVCWSISVSALLFEGIVKPKTVVSLILMSFQTSMLLFVLWNTKGEVWRIVPQLFFSSKWPFLVIIL